MEFHVTCGQNKKLVTVDSIKQLEQAICQRFGVQPPLLLQRWHDAYADWLDIELTPLGDDDNEGQTALQANTRLLAIPLTLPPSRVASAKSVREEDTRDCHEASINHLPSLPSSLAPPAPPTLPLPRPPRTCSTPTPTLSPTPSVDSVGASALPAVEQGPVSNWPTPFVIAADRFDQSLLASIVNAEGGALSRDELTRLLDILFQQIRQYTFYPKTSQYAEVAEALLSLYPQLDEGLPRDDALALWKNRLSQKFRNCRKRGVGFTDEEKARFYARRPPSLAASLTAGSNKRIKLNCSANKSYLLTSAAAPTEAAQPADEYDGPPIASKCDDNNGFGSEFIRNSELLNGIGAFSL